MEKLINELIKAGCSRDRMEIKVFGGGNVIDASTAVGSDNAEFVLRYLEAEGLRCAAEGSGRTHPAAHPLLSRRPAASCAGCSEPAKPTRSVAKSGNTQTGCESRQPAGEIHLFGDAE